MKTMSTNPRKAMAQTPWPYSQYPLYFPGNMPPPGIVTDTEYQMRQMQQMHQMQMQQMMQQLQQMQQMQHNMQQMQRTQQSQQTKVDKSSKKDQRISSGSNRQNQEPTMVWPNPQGPPDTGSVDDVEQGKQIVLGALRSLYEDQIMPHHMLVLRRVQEMYEQRWSPQQLNHICSMIPEIQMVGEGRPQRYNILLHEPPEGFKEFVDQSSQDDAFGSETWEEVELFLSVEAHSAPTGSVDWPGSRYEFAKWIRSRLPCLNNYSLGHICHMVQLCISKKELLGYHQGNLVPYQLSDDCKKKSNAMLLRPTQIQPGEKYVQTWEQAGEMLAQLLEQNIGTVQLSSLKALFRKVFRMELSESALGHAKLSEFLQDPRLRTPTGGSFGLEQRGTQWHIILKEACVESAFSDVQKVSPAEWLAPTKDALFIESCDVSGDPPPVLVAPPPGLEDIAREAVSQKTSQKNKINKIPKNVPVPVPYYHQHHNGQDLNTKESDLYSSSNEEMIVATDTKLMEAIHADILNYLGGALDHTESDECSDVEK